MNQLTAEVIDQALDFTYNSTEEMIRRIGGMMQFETAKQLTADTIDKGIDFKSGLVDRLIFIETARTNKVPEKVFPAIVEDVEVSAKLKRKSFVLCIIQRINGRTNCVKVRLPFEEVGQSVRLWDIPPTVKMRKALPKLVARIAGTSAGGEAKQDGHEASDKAAKDGDKS